MKKLLLSVLFAATAFTAFSMDAVVVSAKGKAEVQNGESWVALKNGDTLNQGSVIQTGFKSEVVLNIKESTVTVAPLSRLTLQQLAEREGVAGAPGKDDTTIFLDTGSLKSNVQKSQDRRVGFTVRSPVATASVRGTEYQVTTKFRSVAVQTMQGKVATWKNTAKSEQAFAVLNDGPVEEASEGNEAQDISEYAPPGSFTVSRGEQASFTSAGQTSTPAQNARATAESLGEGTNTASAGEAAATSSLPTPVAPPPATATAASKPKANLIIQVEFAD